MYMSQGYRCCSNRSMAAFTSPNVASKAETVNRNITDFVLFNDTWSQHGPKVLCMTIFFSLLANHKSRNQRLQVKWAVNLVIADSHCNLPQEFVCVITPEG